MNAENNIKPGGWIPCGCKIEEDPEALAAFEKATQGLLGVKYEPLIVVAKQLVAGMNYCILCKATPMTLDPKPSMKLLFIYKDLEGNAVITAITDPTDSPVHGLVGAADAADNNIVAGGWKITEGDMSIKVHPDAYQALVKATKGMVGATYQPIALLAEQIVSGKNYCILCRITPVTRDPKPTMSLVYVYEDLEGNAMITNIKQIIGAPMPGGFVANPGDTDLDSNPEVKEAFEKATSGIVGVDIVPVAYLGSQVVSGVNYLILCKTNIVVPKPIPKLTLVTVYKDLNGNCEILRTEPLAI